MTCIMGHELVKKSFAYQNNKAVCRLEKINEAMLDTVGKNRGTRFFNQQKMEIF